MFWHDKLFVLNWRLNAKWVLVYFKNGQTKRWWKRTERPYRFKRWFVKSAQGSFSNLANYNHPYIIVYVFSSFFPWPTKRIIPMHVRRFQSAAMPVQMHPTKAEITLQHANVKSMGVQTKDTSCQVNEVGLNMKLVLPQVHIPKLEIINLNLDLNEHN